MQRFSCFSSSLLSLQHDILGRPLGPDGSEVSDDKTSELTLEKDALEWLVAKNSNCGDDCVASPMKERKPAPSKVFDWTAVEGARLVVGKLATQR